ncbi:hypothetical protein LZ30DRAFT_417061 [Colletotrichum cereale]|nr:hypothetical protein LZ30DRAFT_417061 [Colletotrichum cereale]
METPSGRSEARVLAHSPYASCNRHSLSPLSAAVGQTCQAQARAIRSKTSLYWRRVAIIGSLRLMRLRETFVESSQRFGWSLFRCRSPNLAVVAVGTPSWPPRPLAHILEGFSTKEEFPKGGFSRKLLKRSGRRTPICEANGLAHLAVRERMATPASTTGCLMSLLARRPPTGFGSSTTITSDHSA